MKRIMQAMLAVALVVVTAFSFYVNTASAQPISAPVPATTSSPTTPISREQVCFLPALASCVVQTDVGDNIKATIENTSSAVVEIKIVLEGNASTFAIPPLSNITEDFANSNGGEISIHNMSSSGTIKITLRILHRA
jgi:hypothetical protein